MKIAIMQPYFLPYIGYWQLIHAVDTFVVYDNIQYTKKGWINRNRVLVNGKAEYLTIPIKHDSDYLDIIDRRLSDDFEKRKVEILRRIDGLYHKAPYFNEAYPVIESCITDYNNLFGFVFNSLLTIKEYLEIKTKIVISSYVYIDHSLKAQDKVMAICENLGADSYINAIGGVDLYSRKYFESKYIKLNFIKADKIEYSQFGNEFVPWLSILDVMMFNSKQDIKNMLNEYTLI